MRIVGDRRARQLIFEIPHSEQTLIDRNCDISTGCCSVHLAFVWVYWGTIGYRTTEIVEVPSRYDTGIIDR